MTVLTPEQRVYRVRVNGQDHEVIAGKTVDSLQQECESRWGEGRFHVSNLGGIGRKVWYYMPGRT